MGSRVCPFPSPCAGHNFVVLYCMLVSFRVYGQAIDPFASWTLIEVKWNAKKPFPYRISKKYWVLKQFTRHAVPGTFPLPLAARDACEHTVASFFHKRKRYVAVFIVNQQSSKRHVRIDLSGFKEYRSGRPCSIHRVTTSLYSNLVLNDVGSQCPPTSITVTVPRLCFTTIYITNVDM